MFTLREVINGEEIQRWTYADKVALRKDLAEDFNSAEMDELLDGTGAVYVGNGQSFYLEPKGGTEWD